MKKQLYELTVEEFTRLLLDYEEEYTLTLKSYYNDSKDEHTLVGTYEQLCDATITHPQLHQQIEDTLFDYRLTLNELDIYNYLEFTTKNFNTDRVKIVLDEMECFYLLTYTEDIDSKVVDYYIQENIDIPYLAKQDYTTNKGKHFTREKNTIPNYSKMRGVVYPFREYSYHKAIHLLKSKIEINKSSKKALMSTIPKELDTPKAKELLNQAVNKGLISKLETCYRWNDNTDNPIQLQAYFAEKANDYLDLRKSNKKTIWKPFKQLFGIDTTDRKLETAKNDYTKIYADFTPNGCDEIDLFFSELNIPQ